MDFTLLLVIHTTTVIKPEDQGTEWEYVVGKLNCQDLFLIFGTPDMPDI